MSDLNIAVIMRLVNRMRGPAREARADLRGIADQTQEIERRSGRLARVQGAAFVAGRLAMRGVAIAGGAAVAAGGNSARQAITQQDAWSEANRTLELTPVALAALTAEVDRLSTEIPVTRQGLVDIVATAGQLGIRGRADILAFTEDAAKMSATFDIAEAAGAGFMGSWREQMAYTQDEVRLLADQINYLGNTTAADSASIAEFATRVLGVAKTAGMSEEALLALGSAMIASGRAPEVAATGMRALFRTMAAGSGQLSQAQKDIVESIGLAGQWDDIQNQMYTDSEGAILRVVEAIERLPEAQQAAAASDLFGEEANASLGDLLSNADRLREVLDRIPDIAAAAGSMNAEYLALSDDVLDNWARVRNALSIRSQSFGNGMLGPINEGLKSLLGLLTSLDERATVFDRIGAGWQGFTDGFDGEGGAIAAQIDGFTDAIGRFLFGTTDEDAGEVLAGVFYRAQELGEGLGSVRDTVLAAVAPIVDGLRDLRRAAATLFSGDFDGYVEHMRSFWEEIGALQIPTLDLSGLLPDDATGPVRAFVGTLESLLNGVGSTLQFFKDSYVSFQKGFIDGISAAFDPVAASLSAAYDQIAPILANFRGIFSAIGEAVGSAGDTAGLMSLIDGIGRFVGAVAGFAAEGLAKGIAGIASGIALVTEGIGQLAGAGASLVTGDFSAYRDRLNGFLDWLGGLEIPSLDLTGILPDSLAAIDPIRGFVEAFDALINGIGRGLKFFKDAYVSFETGFIDGIAASFEPVAARLSSAYDQIEPVLTNLRRIFDAIGQSFSAAGDNDGLMNVIGEIGRFVGIVAGVAVEGVATAIEVIARAIATITGAVASALEGDWGAAAEEIRSFLTWLADLIFPEWLSEFSFASMFEGVSLNGAIAAVKGWFDFSWADVRPDWLDGFAVADFLPDVSLDGVRAFLAGLFDFQWADVLPDWDWGGIIPNVPDIGALFSDADKTLADRLRSRAETPIAEWEEGTQLIADYEAGLINIQTLYDTIAAKAEGAGFGLLDANMAFEMLKLLDDLEVVGSAIDEMPTVAAVRADTGDVEELQRKIVETLGAAGALPAAVADAVRAAELAATLDLTAAGVAMMETMATGIRSGTAAVVDAVRAMAVQVSAALPTSPAVRLTATAGAVAAADPAVQARAGGGAFGPGWLLTGEEGPELEYRTRSGFIAHHGQLRRMADMSDRVRAATPPIAAATRPSRRPDIRRMARTDAGIANGIASQIPGRREAFSAPSTFPLVGQQASQETARTIDRANRPDPLPAAVAAAARLRPVVEAVAPLLARAPAGVTGSDGPAAAAATIDRADRLRPLADRVAGAREQVRRGRQAPLPAAVAAAAQLRPVVEAVAPLLARAPAGVTGSDGPAAAAATIDRADRLRPLADRVAGAREQVRRDVEGRRGRQAPLPAAVAAAAQLRPVVEAVAPLLARAPAGVAGSDGLRALDGSDDATPSGVRGMIEAAQAIRANVTPRPAPVAAPVRAPTARAGTVTIGDIHVHAAPGQDAGAIARAVRREMKQALRSDDALHDGGQYD